MGPLSTTGRSVPEDQRWKSPCCEQENSMTRPGGRREVGAESDLRTSPLPTNLKISKSKKPLKSLTCRFMCPDFYVELHRVQSEGWRCISLQVL